MSASDWLWWLLVTAVCIFIVATLVVTGDGFGAWVAGAILGSALAGWQWDVRR